MKHSSSFAIICICLMLFSLSGSVASDSAQYDKSVSIAMNIDNGKITAKSMEIYYGSAPNIFPVQDGFKGELVAEDGSTVQSFTVWDPRVQFGDVIVNNANSPRIQSIVDRQNSADTVVIFPFDRKATGFRLYNSADGTLLTSVDLKPQIDSFFASYPNDPDNPVLFGSGAKVSVNPRNDSRSLAGLDQLYGLKAPVINPLLTGTQDSVAKTSGQLWGILTMGSGAVLILVGAFASSWFLRVKPKSVLIVDDNYDIIEVISGMLRNGGYATRTATSGEECLKELETAVPDIILLDIGM